MQAQQTAYEAALAEEKRARQENEQRQAAEMAQMYNFIRGLSIQMGNPIPPMQFPTAPVSTTPPVSTGQPCSSISSITYLENFRLRDMT